MTLGTKIRSTFLVIAALCLIAWFPASAQDVGSSSGAPPLDGSRASDDATAMGNTEAIQCFWNDGTYGQITVTTSGDGCGTSLAYGGITGVWLGDTNVTESCTFTISPAVAAATTTIAMTAHSCSTAEHCETTRFRINGADFDVVEADVDQSTPPGGSDVVILPTGEVQGSATDGDGRATISFARVAAGVTTIEIDHTINIGSPNGTIYLVCVDDVPVELMTISVE